MKNYNKNYSLTKVKSRNFLNNISYNCLKNADFDNALFIIDCYISYLILICFLWNKNLMTKRTENLLKHYGIILFQMNSIFTFTGMTTLLS